MKYLLLSLLALVPSLALAQAPDFVPLTTLPGLNTIEAAANSSLPDFFNTLYKLCIGAAATIAIFNIMVAGFKSITQEGSVIEKGKIRDRITNSLLGLLLVLSPAIVFGIIDPRILNLNIGNLDQLKLSNSGWGLSSEQREYITTQTQEAAASCGFSISSEEAKCLMDNPSSADQCLPEGVTPEQRSCLVGELMERADEAQQCEAMNIRVGSVVQPDFRQCCAQAGLEAQQNGRSSSYVCTDPSAQEESGPVFETEPGNYNYLLYKDTDSCFQLLQGSFPDQAACTESRSSEMEARSFSPLMSCTQVTGTTFTSTIQINEGTELCSSIIKVP